MEYLECYFCQKKYGLPAVFAKNEALNPTSSFKDRGTAVAIQKAVSKGIARIGTVSTGNMASSTAAYGARAGLKTFVLVKEDTPTQKLPVFIGIQARGCSPIAQAYWKGKLTVERIEKADTIAHTISNPDPPGGNIALNLIQAHGGTLLDVSDEEILIAQRILAEQEGIFCLPASATTLAGLFKFSKMQSIKAADQIVLIITGSGLKDVKALSASPMNINHASLSDLEEKMRSLV